MSRHPYEHGIQCSLLLRTLPVLAALWLCGCSKPVTDPQLDVGKVSTWALPPQGLKVPAPRGVAIGDNDDVLVLDTAGRVVVFNADGDVLRSWPMPESDVGKPEGICLLNDGRIVVADTHYHRLVYFDPDGKVVKMHGEYGQDPGQFIYPVAVTQDDEGFIYACEYGGNDRIQKFTPDGEFVLSFGAFGTGEAEFQRPSGLVWQDGRITVTDAINNRVQVFTDDGKYVGRFGAEELAERLHFPYDLCLGADGCFYVIEYGAGRLTRFDAEGRLIGRFGVPGSDIGQFVTPWGLAIDSQLRCRIADTGNHRMVTVQLAPVGDATAARLAETPSPIIALAEHPREGSE
jgi:sugar lactone lactonase YvrE